MRVRSLACVGAALAAALGFAVGTAASTRAATGDSVKLSLRHQTPDDYGHDTVIEVSGHVDGGFHGGTVMLGLVPNGQSCARSKPVASGINSYGAVDVPRGPRTYSTSFASSFKPPHPAGAFTLCGWLLPFGSLSSTAIGSVAVTVAGIARDLRVNIYPPGSPCVSVILRHCGPGDRNAGFQEVTEFSSPDDARLFVIVRHAGGQACSPSRAGERGTAVSFDRLATSKPRGQALLSPANYWDGTPDAGDGPGVAIGGTIYPDVQSGKLGLEFWPPFDSRNGGLPTPPGRYLVCAWIQRTAGDARAEVGPVSATVTIGWSNFNKSR